MIIFQQINFLIIIFKFVLFAPLLLAEESGEKHGGFGHATDGQGHAVHHAGKIIF